MKENQSYDNHTKMHPFQHYVLMPLSFVTLILAIVALVRAIGKDEATLLYAIVPVIVVLIIMTAILARINPLKAQDRIIRLEEQYRYFRLAGVHAPEAVTPKQWIALRFASDDEFIALTDRAVREQLTPDAIKRAITTWRPDAMRI